ncbi:two component system sensor kinase [Yersinia hibernica]|uniref:histidine kinase n=1 Tax=Yersinia enterocolitica LC20 TaxID=1443113 RepID=A0A7U4GIJ3_YEREN|nr:two component system sensor kinase [Yersinia hibernica]AHM76170.1 hybrid sensor histidine kinase/response regulator [Yersinia hibernica]OVZ84779.1 hybrid sensor histidine kinase/response regulator [Yersinia kristensenii]
MKKSSSLVTRLTLLLGMTLTAIWLISIVMTAFFSYEDTRQRLVNELTHIASLRSDLSNYQFEGAERDALALIDRQSHYQMNWELPILLKNEDAKNNTLVNSITCNSPQSKHDFQVNQAYSSSGQTYYLDSFTIKRSNGITIFKPQAVSNNYLKQRRKELLLLPVFPTHDNIFWGMPTYTAKNGWHISVAACDQMGSLAGFSLKLNELVNDNQSVEKRDINLWLDKDGKLLPLFQQNIPSNQLYDIIRQLKGIHLHDGWQQTPDYLVLRTQLKGPGWQQLVIYPRIGFAWEAAKPALHQLPFALAILLLLTLALSLLLRYYLAIPLWNFVNIIGATGPQAMEPRLPIKRMDELGHIARAYNSLLDTLNKQYDTLEMKVQERTMALAKSKLTAEQANQRKSTHLTTISHEIRTPLNGALGAVELLQNTPLTTEQYRLAETARQCSYSLLAIINNLLDFSRIESGQLTLSQEKIALLPLLDQAMLTIHSQVLSKSIVLSTYVSSDVPLELELDSQRIKQILVNLLGNAVKFTQQGHISLTVERKGQQLCFAVEDTGCGIDLQHQQKIFRPFIQTYDHGQGTGLGLTIADNLAKMMGGHITLYSKPNSGSRFSLILPFNGVTPVIPFKGEFCSSPPSLQAQLSAWGITCQPINNKSVNPPQEFLADKELCYLPGRLYTKVKQYLGNKEHAASDYSERQHNLPLQPWCMSILLVDDAETNRDITGMMLKQLGHEVTLAESGEMALRIGQSQCFDLVLMDIRMPSMDGLTTTQYWRNDVMNLDNRCMITALSANTNPDEKIRAYQAGMNHYISKPVTFSQLAIVLDLTAQFQLERGINLIPQITTSRPLLNLTDSSLRLTLSRSLQELLQQARDSLTHIPTLSDHLHTLKGCAGQAGLIELQDAVIQLEIAIEAKKIITQQDITRLDEMIHWLFQPWSPRNAI